MVAVSVTIGVSVMVSSFRYTVIQWLAQTLQGDIYISPAGVASGRSQTAIDPQVITVLQRLARHPGDLHPALAGRPFPSGPIHIAATDNPHVAAERAYLWRKGSTADIQRGLATGGVILSEPLANRLGVTAATPAWRCRPRPACKSSPSWASITITPPCRDQPSWRWMSTAAAGRTPALPPSPSSCSPAPTPTVVSESLQVQPRPRPIPGHPSQPGIAARGARRLRPHLRHHRRHAAPGDPGRLYRRAQRLALRGAGAPARARHPARRGSHRAPDVGLDDARDRLDRRCRRALRHARRLDPGGYPDLYHQLALVRLDSADGIAPPALHPGAVDRPAGCLARRRLPRHPPRAAIDLARAIRSE